MNHEIFPCRALDVFNEDQRESCALAGVAVTLRFRCLMVGFTGGGQRGFYVHFSHN